MTLDQTLKIQRILAVLLVVLIIVVGTIDIAAGVPWYYVALLCLALIPIM